MAKKRTNGEGYIRQRKNGLWECTIMDGFQPNGKRKYKSFYGNIQSESQEKDAHLFPGEGRRGGSRP